MGRKKSNSNPNVPTPPLRKSTRIQQREAVEKERLEKERLEKERIQRVIEERKRQRQERLEQRRAAEAAAKAAEEARIAAEAKAAEEAAEAAARAAVEAAEAAARAAAEAAAEEERQRRQSTVIHCRNSKIKVRLKRLIPEKEFNKWNILPAPIVSPENKLKLSKRKKILVQGKNKLRVSKKQKKKKKVVEEENVAPQYENNEVVLQQPVPKKRIKKSRFLHSPRSKFKLFRVKKIDEKRKNVLRKIVQQKKRKYLKKKKVVGLKNVVTPQCKKKKIVLQKPVPEKVKKGHLLHASTETPGNKLKLFKNKKNDEKRKNVLRKIIQQKKKRYLQELGLKKVVTPQSKKKKVVLQQPVPEKKIKKRRVLHSPFTTGNKLRLSRNKKFDEKRKTVFSKIIQQKKKKYLKKKKVVGTKNGVTPQYKKKKVLQRPVSEKLNKLHFLPSPYATPGKNELRKGIQQKKEEKKLMEEKNVEISEPQLVSECISKVESKAVSESDSKNESEAASESYLKVKSKTVSESYSKVKSDEVSESVSKVVSDEVSESNLKFNSDLLTIQSELEIHSMRVSESEDDGSFYLDNSLNVDNILDPLSKEVFNSLNILSNSYYPPISAYNFPVLDSNSAFDSNIVSDSNNNAISDSNSASNSDSDASKANPGSSQKRRIKPPLIRSEVFSDMEGETSEEEDKPDMIFEYEKEQVEEPFDNTTAREYIERVIESRSVNDIIKEMIMDTSGTKLPGDPFKIMIDNCLGTLTNVIKDGVSVMRRCFRTGLKTYDFKSALIDHNKYTNKMPFYNYYSMVKKKKNLNSDFQMKPVSDQVKLLKPTKHGSKVKNPNQIKVKTLNQTIVEKRSKNKVIKLGGNKVNKLGGNKVKKLGKNKVEQLSTNKEHEVQKHNKNEIVNNNEVKRTRPGILEFRSKYTGPRRFDPGLYINSFLEPFDASLFDSPEE